MSSFTTSLIGTALLAFAASAAQARDVHFTQDGYEYSAEVTELPDGSTRIKGRELVTGKTFKLDLKDQLKRSAVMLSAAWQGRTRPDGVTFSASFAQPPMQGLGYWA